MAKKLTMFHFFTTGRFLFPMACIQISLFVQSNIKCYISVMAQLERM